MYDLKILNDYEKNRKKKLKKYENCLKEKNSKECNCNKLLNIFKK